MPQQNTVAHDPMSLDYIAPHHSPRATVIPNPPVASWNQHNAEQQRLRLPPFAKLDEVSRRISSVNVALPSYELGPESSHQFLEHVPSIQRGLWKSASSTTSFPLGHSERHPRSYRPPTPVSQCRSCPSLSPPGSPCRSSRSNSLPSHGSCRSRRSNSRVNRYEYDYEEQYAICYLRSLGHPRWKEIVEHHWPKLFPPGRLRRPSAPLPAGKTLPLVYPGRGRGGLQCRYYRKRKTADMKPVRDARKVGADADEEPLERLEMKLVQAWVKYIGPAQLADLGLTRRVGEDDDTYLERAKVAYKEHSEFSQLLRSLNWS